jgi:hypothetical protein
MRPPTREAADGSVTDATHRRRERRLGGHRAPRTKPRPPITPRHDGGARRGTIERTSPPARTARTGPRTPQKADSGRFSMPLAQSRDPGDGTSTRRTGGSVPPARAPRRTRPRPTPAGPPGCRRADAGRARSRRRDGSASGLRARWRSVQGARRSRGCRDARHQQHTIGPSRADVYHLPFIVTAVRDLVPSEEVRDD